MKFVVKMGMRLLVKCGTPSKHIHIRNDFGENHTRTHNAHSMANECSDGCHQTTSHTMIGTLSNTIDSSNAMNASFVFFLLFYFWFLVLVLFDSIDYFDRSQMYGMQILKISSLYVDFLRLYCMEKLVLQIKFLILDFDYGPSCCCCCYE